MDAWFLIEITGDIQVSLTLIFVYFILIVKSNINQMFNLFVCITKMRNCLKLEHRFMLQVGVKQKEERHLIDSKKLAFHSSVTVNVIAKKVIEDLPNKIV